MIDLNLERLNALLDEAVAERGADYIYHDEDGQKAGTVDAYTGNLANCRYVHQDVVGRAAPGCLVGLVLHKAGASLDKLLNYEGRNADEVFMDLLASTSYDEAEAMGSLLMGVQAEQDNGKPWGEAVRLARLNSEEGEE